MVNGASGTSKAVVVLLDQARSKRAAAERARQLARTVTTDRILDELTRYAEELKQSAIALEQRASALAETVARNHSLSTEVKTLIEKAHARLEAMRSRKPS